MNTIDVNFRLFSYRWKISIRHQWIQFCIILSAILGGTIVSYWGSSRTLSLLIVLLVGIGATLILMRHPSLGFILVLLGGMFVRWSGPSGLNAAALVIAVLLTIWLVDMLVVKRRFQFANTRVLLPVTIFLVISIVAFVLGQVPWFIFANQAPLDAQAGGFAIFVLSAGALFLSAHLIQNIRWLESIVWVFLGLGTLYMVGRILGIPAVDKIYHLGFTAGSMFWVWMVTLSLSQAIFNTQLKKRARGVLFAVVLMTLYVAVVQAYDWKSGWIPPLVSAAVLLGARYPRLIKFAAPVALLLVGFLALRLIASDEYSWGTRMDAWVIVLEISRVSPILGMGFSNYYWYTPLYSIRGWNVNFNAHSQYVDLIAQVGIVGLFCFIWIFFEMGRLSWSLSKRLPDGFARAYAYGILAGVAGTLVAAFLVDWVLPFVYNIGFTGFRASILPWMFMGGLVAIQQMNLGAADRASK